MFACYTIFTWTEKSPNVVEILYQSVCYLYIFDMVSKNSSVYYINHNYQMPAAINLVRLLQTSSDEVKNVMFVGLRFGELVFTMWNVSNSCIMIISTKSLLSHCLDCSFLTSTKITRLLALRKKMINHILICATLMWHYVEFQMVTWCLVYIADWSHAH